MSRPFKKMRVWILRRLGGVGRVQLLQTFVFTMVGILPFLLIPAEHRRLFSLPLFLAGGIMCMQPSHVTGWNLTKRIVLFYASGCGISFVLLFLFGPTLPAYIAAILLIIIVFEVRRFQPFPILTLISANICFMAEPSYPGRYYLNCVMAFCSVTLGCLLGYVVNRVIHISLKKQVAALYRQFGADITAKTNRICRRDEISLAGTQQLLTSIRDTQGLYRRENEKHLSEAEVAELDLMYNTAGRILFCLNVLSRQEIVIPPELSYRLETLRLKPREAVPFEEGMTQKNEVFPDQPSEGAETLELFCDEWELFVMSLRKWRGDAA